MVSFTALLALSASALAAPAIQASDITAQATIPANWAWHVEGWSMGCTGSGCIYGFNVTVPSIEGKIAGVKAYCVGNENGWYRKGNWYKPCQILEGVNNGVSAKFSERVDDNGTYPDQILLSFAKTALDPLDGISYNFTGSHEALYNQFVPPADTPPSEFDVTPTAVTAVA